MAGRIRFNRYAYANNNPYKYVDPDGKFGVPTNHEMEYLRSPQALENAIKIVNAVDTASNFTGIGGAIKAVGKAGIKQIAKRSCCFVSGTQVLTESGYKNIEDIELGEKLWAKNTETGEQDWKPVTKVFVEPERGIFEIKLVDKAGFEQKIQATDDHPFYVVNIGWRTTLELQAGDEIETDRKGSMKVVSVTDEQRFDLTYNFTVADFHTYYVTKKNVLVHNCTPKKIGELNPIDGSGHQKARPELEKLSDNELLNSARNPTKGDNITVNTRTDTLSDGNGRVIELQKRAADPNSKITNDTLVPVRERSPDMSMFPDL